MNIHKTTALIVSCLCILFFVTPASAQISVETIGAVRLINIDKGEQYGAGAVIGYDLNKYVKGFVRVIGYETDNWGGTAIDEGSLGVEAQLLRSANGKFSLSAIGSVNRNFEYSKLGLSGGGKVSAVVYKSLYAFGQGEFRFWDGIDKDALITFGLGLHF